MRERQLGTQSILEMLKRHRLRIQSYVNALLPKTTLNNCQKTSVEDPSYHKTHHGCTSHLLECASEDFFHPNLGITLFTWRTIK